MPCLGATAACFLYDTRLKFLENGDGDGEGKGAPMACAMIYWGANYDDFFEIFLEFGAVVDLRDLEDKIPDARTIWLFREQLTRHELHKIEVIGLMNLVYNVRRLVQIDKLRASGVRHSQIDVFERVSSPRDWDLLYALESLTNPSRYPCTRVTAAEPQTACVDA